MKGKGSHVPRPVTDPKGKRATDAASRGPLSESDVKGKGFKHVKTMPVLESGKGKREY